MSPDQPLPHCITCSCWKLMEDPDDVIRQRRRDLDKALSTPHLRGTVEDEPIVRRTLTEPVR